MSSRRLTAVRPGFRLPSRNDFTLISAASFEPKKAFYMIGGIEDHVHMYLRWRPDGAVSDLMRTVKSQDFKSELLRVLRENNVKFDERYVFD